MLAVDFPFAGRARGARHRFHNVFPSCSKSNDVTITRAGLALKNEIEKIREQVQNLE